MNVGILAVQGAVSEHRDMLKKVFKDEGITGIVHLVRTKDDLDHVGALVIPGGESTTISRIISKHNLYEPIKHRAKNGMPVLGTCAGLIVLATKGDSEVKKTDTKLLGLMDMKVQRNAFGRQKESFETSIHVDGLDDPYHAVFIRAPSILETNGDCKPIAYLEDTVIAAKQGNVMAVAFHPELTDDTRIHRMFLDML